MRLACLTAIIGTLCCTASAVAQAPDMRRRMYPTQDGYRCERVTEGDALLKEDGAPRAQTPAPPPPGAERRPSGPSDEEIDRALDVMERFLRRFMGIVREGRGERT